MLNFKSQLMLMDELGAGWFEFSDVLLQGWDGSCPFSVLLLAAASPTLAGLLPEQDEAVLVLPDFSLQQIRMTVSSLVDRTCFPDPELFNLLFSNLKMDWTENFHQSVVPVVESDITVESDYFTGTDTIDETDPDDPTNVFPNACDVNDGSTGSDLTLVDRREAGALVDKHVGYNLHSKLFNCNICKQFQSALKKIISTHIMKHLEIFTYKCEVCDKKFRQQGNFNRHVKTHEKDARKHSPKLVNKTVKKNSRNEDQTQSEHFSNVTEVDVPDITKADRSDLDGKLISFKQGMELIKDVIEKINQEYRCKLCGKDCGRIIGNCRDHIWRVHFNVYLYKCNSSACDRRFRKLTDYKDHVKQHEEKESLLRSLVERRETNLDPAATFHTLSQPIDVSKEKGFDIAALYFFHDPVQRKYKCKLCEFTHSRLQGSRNHVLANHLNQVYLFKCQHCGKRFRYENQFKLHLAVHKEGKFVCSQCGKQLVTKRYLVQHERTGHGAQEISCQEAGCKYRGKTLVQMERHRKVYHDKDRSDWHFCEICAKPFPYINDLKVHLVRCAEGKSLAFKRVRLNKYFLKQSEESFLCLVCNLNFRTYRGITDHLKKDHDLLEEKTKL